MREQPKKRHYQIHHDDLCDLLGIEGVPYKVWAELDNEYLHIMVLDETGQLVPKGGYVDSQMVTTSEAGKCDSCDRHESLKKVSFNVCASCAPSTTSPVRPATIPVHAELAS